jgi:zinc transport system substrate-binding protein
MKKFIIFILIILSVFFVGSCSVGEASSDEEALTVAVGIVPEATFVEKVAGDLAEVVILIPPGNSPANYQPSTSEMQGLSDAQIYFSMQMPTEEANILPEVSSFNEDIEIIYLRDETAEVYPLLSAEDHEHEADSEEESVDPHIWLSPKRTMIIVQTIADELSDLDEENREIYQSNAQAYIEELEALDEEIKTIVSETDNKAFMIYHGSYGYFADDYGLEMITIEEGGKEATAAQIEEVIDYAKENDIKTIFYQVEFDDSQAETVAAEIGGSVEMCAPLSADYTEELLSFAEFLKQDGE